MVVCLIGVVGWAVHTHTKSQASDGLSQPPQVNYSSLYTQIQNKLAQLPSITTTSDSWAAQSESGAVLKAGGYNFSISSEMFNGLRIGATADYNPQTDQEDLSSVASNAVSSVMNQAGYTLSSKKYNATGYAPGDKMLPADSPVTVFVKGASTCVYAYSSGAATFSCFTQSDIINALKKAEPFVTAYRKANRSDANQPLIFGPVTIKSQEKSGVIGPSQATGYDISEAVVATPNERKVVIYYKKDPGPWVYVTKAMDEFGFSCDAYAVNADTTKAFYNQVCLGPNGQIHFGTGTKATQ